MRRSIRHTVLLALAAAATAVSTAALAHPGVPGHTHDGLTGGSDYLVAMIAGALAASLTVWALSRRRARDI